MLFPIYCIGLLTKKEKILNNKCRYGQLLFGLLVFIGISFIGDKYVQPDFIYKIVYTIFVEIIFLVFIIELGKIFKGNIEYLLNKIGYSSMCAYLFHRQIYGLLSRLFGNFSFIEAIIAFAIVIIACFYIQTAYDFLCKKIIK